jgi:hypothetical protein
MFHLDSVGGFLAAFCQFSLQFVVNGNPDHTFQATIVVIEQPYDFNYVNCRRNLIRREYFTSNTPALEH